MLEPLLQAGFGRDQEFRLSGTQRNRESKSIFLPILIGSKYSYLNYPGLDPRFFYQTIENHITAMLDRTGQ